MNPRGHHHARRGTLLALMFLALSALLITCANSGATEARASVQTATASTDVNLYAVLSRKAYVNNHDDLSRGEGHNPFGNYSGPTTPPPTDEKAFGPFAGDEGEFAFKLYNDPNDTKNAGTAIFICQYNFNQGAFCDASLELNGGTLTGKGSENFNAQTFTLAVLGGTGQYLGVTGEMAVTALGTKTQAQPVYRAVPLLQSTHLTAQLASSNAAGASGSTRLTEYSTPTHENFVNNDDDEARGDVNNPFGIHNTRGAANKESGDGPFPGDLALFTFQVFANADLQGKSAPAIYTCQYYFHKNAFCDALFEVGGGSLTAAGIVNFNGKTFTLTVTGGSGRYTGRSGELHATPQGAQAQQLSFDLA